MLDRAVRRALERFARNSELLSLVDAGGIDRLAHFGEIEHREAGETIVRQGESDAHTFYLVVAGTLSVNIDHAGGSERVAVLEAGSFFGEIGALTGQPRTATVASETPVELIVFAREPVLEVLGDYPAAYEAVSRVGLARSEETIDRSEGGLAEALEGPEHDNKESN